MDVIRVIRAGVWALASLVACLVVAYAMLVIVNRDDAPPSPDARKLTAIIRDRPALADGANGYVHLLGIAALPDADPVALGSRRKAWIEAFVAPAAEEAVIGLPGPVVAYRERRSPEAIRLATACSNADTCLAALEARPEDLTRWLASERWLLQRYRRMLATRGWREAVPDDLRAPMAGFQDALDLQKLHLLDVRRHARAGDPDVVRDLLDRDLVFWRRVLASSDLLVSKMVAVAAVRRHFELGNLALRELPPGVAGSALPATWRQPMTLAERSLARALAGEWQSTRAVLSMAMASPASAPGVTRPGRLFDRLLRPLMQLQATLNLGAARMVRLGLLSERPHAALQATLEAEQRAQAAAPITTDIRNPVGALLDSIAASAHYTDYMARASDLEGLRRTALLVATLRGTGVVPADVADVAAAVREASLRNPYDGTAFGWEASDATVAFQGLAKGDRGRYRLRM